MCRLFFAICAIMLVSLGSQAQINDTVIDTSSDPVLNELQIIRGIHEETRNQRKRAIEERQRRDSLQNRESEEDLMSDYGVMARIEDNTHQRPMTDGWNLYGILAFAIAVISAAISWYTYKEQRKTEGNTKNAAGYPKISAERPASSSLSQLCENLCNANQNGRHRL